MNDNVNREKMEKRKNTNAKILKFGCLPVLIITMLIFILIPKKETLPEDGDVKNIARSVIIKEMKDPTSVQFFHNEIITKKGDSIYTYRESLKSASGIGLLIAQDAIVTLKWNGQKPSEFENWKILNLSFERR